MLILNVLYVCAFWCGTTKTKDEPTYPKLYTVCSWGTDCTDCGNCPTCKSCQRVSGSRCVSCPSGQYKYGTNKATSCSPQTECRTRGQYLSGSSCSTAGKCEYCPSGTYQPSTSSAHRQPASSCKSQNTCGRGDYLDGASSSAKGSCRDCPPGKYQPSTSSAHRQPLSSCKFQSSCTAGYYLRGASSSAKGSCSKCGPNTYQSDGSGSCLSITKLASSECPSNRDLAQCHKVSVDSLCEGDGECGTSNGLNNCGGYDMYRKTGHRKSVCDPHNTCGRGDYLDGASSSAKGSCKDCPSGKYQPSTSSAHRQPASSCKSQNTCGRGNYLDGASSSAKGSCRDCPSGKYQPSTSSAHRQPASSCKFQSSCTAGYYLRGASSSAKGSCSKCGPNTYQSDGSGSCLSITKLASSECPSNRDLAQCHKVSVDSLCEGDGECGTSNGLNNCDGGYDMYRKTGHRKSVCDTQPTCRHGQRISADSNSVKRTCTNCPGGQYQLVDNGRVTSCEACDNAECPTNQFRSGTCDSTTGQGYKCNTCTNVECASYEYRSGTCSGTSNGFSCHSTTTTTGTDTTTTTASTTTATVTTSTTTTITSTTVTTTTVSTTTITTSTTTTIPTTATTTVTSSASSTQSLTASSTVSTTPTTSASSTVVSTLTTTASTSPTSTASTTATSSRSSTATTTLTTTATTSQSSSASTSLSSTATTTVSTTVATTVTSTDITTETSTATSTASSTATTSVSSTQSTSLSSTQSSTASTSQSSTGSTSVTSTPSTSASSTASTTQSSTAETTQTTTAASTVTATAQTSATTTGSSSVSSSITSTASTSASTTVSSTPSTTASSTATSSLSSTATSTVTTTPTSTVTTTMSSTRTTTASSTDTSTQTTTQTTTVTTGMSNKVHDFVENGALFGLFDTYTKAKLEEQLGYREQWAKYTGIDVYERSKDAYTKGNTLSTAADCRAGYFLQYSAGSVEEGGCTPCFPGTHSADLYQDSKGNDRSGDKHKCSGECPEGYTSPFGSRSEASCTPTFKVIMGAQSSRRRHRSVDADSSAAYSTASRWRTCEGAFDTTGNRWKNRGYTYVTSREECEEAARLLNMIDVFAVTVTQIEDHCADINMLTGSSDANTTFICENVKENQGGTCSVFGSTFTNSNGAQPLSVDCKGTCSECGQNTQFCRSSREVIGLSERFPLAAPVGYCVLEQSKTGSGDQQRLSFYDECSAAHYDGSSFSPICKVLECPLDEQIKGTGAKFVGAGLPWDEQMNAECESNDILKALLESRQNLMYKPVYSVIAMIGVLCYIGLFLVWRSQDPSKHPTITKEFRGCSWTMSETWWRDFKTASYLWFKLADVTSDWGFWGIEVRDNLVFESNMFLNELDFGKYRSASLGFTVIGTLLIGADIFALFKRYRHSEVKDIYKEKVKGLSFLLRILTDPVDDAHWATWVFPLLIGIFEDIPQIALSIIYLIVMGTSDFRDQDSSSFLDVLSITDPLAVFSLTLSSIGLIMNIIYGFNLPSLFTCMASASKRFYEKLYMAFTAAAKVEKVFFHGNISEVEAVKRLKEHKVSSSKRSCFGYCSEETEDDDVPFLSCIVWQDGVHGNIKVNLPTHKITIETLTKKDVEDRAPKPTHGTDTVKMLTLVTVSGEELPIDRDLTLTAAKDMHWMKYSTRLIHAIERDNKTMVSLVPDPGVVWNVKERKLQRTDAKDHQSNGHLIKAKERLKEADSKLAHLQSKERSEEAQWGFVDLQADNANVDSSDDISSRPVLILSGSGGLMGSTSADGGSVLLFSNSSTQETSSDPPDSDKNNRRSSFKWDGSALGEDSSTDGVVSAVNKMTRRIKGAARHASLRNLGESRFKEAVNKVMLTYRQIEEQDGLTKWDHVLQEHVDIPFGPLIDDNENLDSLDLSIFSTEHNDNQFENVIKAVKNASIKEEEKKKKKKKVEEDDAAIEFEAAVHTLKGMPKGVENISEKTGQNMKNGIESTNKMNKDEIYNNNDALNSREAAIEFEAAVHALKQPLQTAADDENVQGFDGISTSSFGSERDEYIEIHSEVTSNATNAAFFDGEAAIAAKEKGADALYDPYNLVSPAFFEGNAAIEAAELEGRSENPRINAFATAKLSNATNAAFFDGEAAIAAKEKGADALYDPYNLVSPAFFEGNAAIEAAELEGRSENPRINAFATAKLAAQTHHGVGLIDHERGPLAAPARGASGLQRKIASFYHAKMVPVALEVIRNEMRPRWNDVKKRWALLRDVPADCHFDLQRDARLDEEV